jgi:GNAT superfamily N-acetyltransferase
VPQIHVRPFHRRDREQLTSLVNAHAAAVVPGISISVAAMLSDLERQPDEFITDPWVSERLTLVADQGNRVVAAAHLLRYFTDERAGEDVRGTGEIRWLVFWPEAPAGNPYWPDATQAAEMLIAVCIRQFDEWDVDSQDAGGELPVPGVYGVPEQWPHVRALYERAGFRHKGRTEVVHLARIEDLPRPSRPPVDGLSVRRSVGMNGTRLSADLGEQVIGYIEVDTFHEGQRLNPHGGWADIGNLCVAEGYRRRGIASWLLGQAADWLQLAHVDRLLDYTSLGDPAEPDETGYRMFLAAVGFGELTRTQRVWTRDAVRPRRPGGLLSTALRYARECPRAGRTSPGARSWPGARSARSAGSPGRRGPRRPSE